MHVEEKHDQMKRYACPKCDYINLPKMAALSVSDNSKSRLELSHSDSSFENEDAKFAACEDRTNQTNYEFGRANVKQIKIIFFSF